MTSRFAVLTALATCLFACAGVDVDSDRNDFEDAPEDAGITPPHPALPQDDGEPCEVDSDCVNGVCAQILPDLADASGICWGPKLSSCVDAAGFDRWSYDACLDIGLTDAVCPPVMNGEMQERCVKSDVPHPGGFDYVCCETTFIR